MNSPLRLAGIGLRSPHYATFIETKPAVAWVEVHSENFFAEGGTSLSLLEQVRTDYPVSLHGVNLSLGSADELNWQHLKKLKDLIVRVDPCLVSDHLAWTSINGHYLHDLLPVPYTEETLQHLVARLQTVQEYLRRPLLIENISAYVSYPASEMSEWEFLQETAERAGCGILLDVNNIHVSAVNLGFDPLDYIKGIAPHLVQEIHLSGFTERTVDNNTILIDSHNRPVALAVWELYQAAIQQLGLKPTIIEWDDELPSLDVLLQEARHAEKLMRENYVAAKLTG